MKEVTEWNGVPRMMWVWNDSFDRKEKLKVIYIFEDSEFPVITLDKYRDLGYWKHCAEIEEPKTRRMTNKELSWWLKGGPTREWKYKCTEGIKGVFTYSENEKNTLVNDDILIRENDGEWHEPLVEVVE